MDFKRSGVTKNQHLDNRRANEDKPRPLVAEDLNELLDQHLLQARQHLVSFYSNLLWKLRVASIASNSANTANGIRSA